MELVSGDFTINSPAAILPGSFNPPTIAHLGLAEAALARVATVVFVLPRAFPHKSYDGVAQTERLALLNALTPCHPRFAVAISDGGLFAEMARELRQLQPSLTEIFLVCGRDAAERILSWHYPEADPIERQLDEFRLLVAARQGACHPPAQFADRIELLITDSNWDDVSSTSVRNAINSGASWRHLVPTQIHELVETLYSPSRFDSKNVRSR